MQHVFYKIDKEHAVRVPVYCLCSISSDASFIQYLYNFSFQLFQCVQAESLSLCLSVRICLCHPPPSFSVPSHVDGNVYQMPRGRRGGHLHYLSYSKIYQFLEITTSPTPFESLTVPALTSDQPTDSKFSAVGKLGPASTYTLHHS